MLSKSIKIVAPKIFELYVEDINIGKDECLVKVDKGAICKADLRYYEGLRSERILGLKYPMNLIHEMAGTIVKDPSGKFIPGDKVVLVPNLVFEEDKSENDKVISENKYLGENYCECAKFASSNYDGFAKSVVAWPVKNIVKCYDDISSDILVFSELISVGVSAFRRLEDIAGDFESVCIWGDGIVGYIISSIAKNIYNKKVFVVGKHDEKLKYFCCDKRFNLENIENQFVCTDVFVECVGGKGMESAVNEMLKISKPGSKILLTGVSENSMKIDTRKILEKGIVITGTTRSNVDDFHKVMSFFRNKDFTESINKLNLGEFDIENITDFYRVFEKTNEESFLGKYIMNFKF